MYSGSNFFTSLSTLILFYFLIVAILVGVRASLVAQLVKNPPAMWEIWVQSLGWEDPLERGKATTPVFWPEEFHERYSPWGHKESDMTERLSVHLVGVKWYLTVVFICIFLMTNNFEHLLTCFLATCISLLQNYPFRSLAQILIRSFVFLSLSCKSSLQIAAEYSHLMEWSSSADPESRAGRGTEGRIMTSQVFVSSLDFFLILQACMPLPNDISAWM